MRLVRKLKQSSTSTLAISLISLAISIGIFSIIFWGAGINILDGYSELLKSGFTGGGLNTTIRRTGTLFLLALAFIIPNKAGLWNIGGQGQFFLGIIGAAGISYAFSGMSGYLLIPIMAIAAMVTGGIWGLIPGYLKSKLDVNEIVVSLMLNYVAIQLVNYLVVRGPWMSPSGRPESMPIPEQAHMPMIGGTSIPISIIVPIVALIVFFFVFKKTRLGYEITTIGSKFRSARYAGISHTKIYLFTMVIGGALAGFAGMSHLTAVTGFFRSNIIPPWGYYAIVFGLFVGLDLVSALLYTFIITGFLVGTKALQITFGMHHGISLLFVGLIIVVNIALQVFREYNIKRS